MTIKIRAPIWKTRSIGIAEYKLKENTKIEIIYCLKNGERLYPGIYSISKKEALKYPIQYIKGIKLRIIPIEQLKNKKKDDKEI